MADSSALLSTCAGAGATLVAIVGGLLVSRYLSLESEALSLKKLIRTLDEKLADARLQAVESKRVYERHALREHILQEDRLLLFFEVEAGDRTLPEVVDRLDLAAFDTDTAHEVVGEFHDEVKQVVAFDWNLVPHTDQHDYWSDFRRASDIRPNIDEVWEYMYVDVCRARPSRNQSQTFGSTLDPATLGIVSPAEQNEKRDTRNRLIAARDESGSGVQRLESDRAAAALSADSMVRPPGLVSGLAVLAFLTVTSVIVPVLLLAPTPATLSYGQSVAVVGSFFIGIVVLFGYLGTHVQRLRRLTSGKT